MCIKIPEMDCNSRCHVVQAVPSRRLHRWLQKCTLACIARLSPYIQAAVAEVALPWWHAPIFFPYAGSIWNGAQIASSDLELQEDGVLWYGSLTDRNGQVLGDSTWWASGETLFLRKIWIHIWYTHRHTEQSRQSTAFRRPACGKFCEAKKQFKQRIYCLSV